ncbi:MAG: hypothetical protein AAF310_06060, partial [Myxococcota bacterium]
ASAASGWTEEVSFSADGKYLAAPALGNKLRVWELPAYHRLNLTGATGLPPQTLQALQKWGAVVNQRDDDNDDQKEEE